MNEIDIYRVEIGQVWHVNPQHYITRSIPQQVLAIHVQPVLGGAVCGWLLAEQKFIIQDEFVDRNSSTRWIKIRSFDLQGWVMTRLMWHRCSQASP